MLLVLDSHLILAYRLKPTRSAKHGADGSHTDSHVQKKRDSLLGDDAVVSPVAPSSGIRVRKTTFGGNDTKGCKTKITDFGP